MQFHAGVKGEGDFVSPGGVIRQSFATVALVDSQVDASLFKEWPGRFAPLEIWASFCEHGQRQYDFDYPSPQSHGTHMAKTIADNSTNVVILPCDAHGTTPHKLSRKGCIDAINYLVKMKNDPSSSLYFKNLRVINCSFSSDSSDAEEQSAVRRALESGILVVACAGNDGDDREKYPAYYPETFCVSATDGLDFADYSNYGERVDASAPGLFKSTKVGTSFSSACASALAGDLFAMDMDATPSQVATVILSTALDLGEPGFNEQFGYGKINPLKARQAMADPASRHWEPLWPRKELIEPAEPKAKAEAVLWPAERAIRQAKVREKAEGPGAEGGRRLMPLVAKVGAAALCIVLLYLLIDAGLSQCTGPDVLLGGGGAASEETASGGAASNGSEGVSEASGSATGEASKAACELTAEAPSGCWVVTKATVTYNSEDYRDTYEMTLDEHGNVISRTTTSSYGKMTTSDSAAYDAFGRTTSGVDRGLYVRIAWPWSEECEVDSQGRPVRSQGDDASASRVVAWTYGDNGLLKSYDESYSTGTVYHFEFDSEGHVLSSKSQTSSGGLSAITYAYERDAAGKLTGFTKATSVEDKESAESSSSGHYSCECDEAGNVVLVRKGNRRWEYTYAYVEHPSYAVYSRSKAFLLDYS